MPQYLSMPVSGGVTDLFAHRFVVQLVGRRILADLTPKGAEQIALSVGDQVTLWGEMKPSELKVERCARNGEDPAATIEHHRPHDDHSYADPAPALATARSAGYQVFGEPRRKPKHFEVLGKGKDGKLSELHVELDGKLRKTKDADLQKWAADIATF